MSQFSFNDGTKLKALSWRWSTLLLPCLIRFIWPSNNVAAALVYPEPGRHIDDLIVISRDVTTRGGKTFVSIFIRSSTVPGLLHAAERWIKVEEQGPPDQLWEDAAPAEVTQPKWPPPLSISTSREKKLRTLSSTHRIGWKISPSFGTWVSRSMTTTNLPLRMFLLATHPLSMGGTLGRAGVGVGWH